MGYKQTYSWVSTYFWPYVFWLNKQYRDHRASSGEPVNARVPPSFLHVCLDVCLVLHVWPSPVMSLADWKPQTELPRAGPGSHRPRRRDRLLGRLPPPAQHRVLLRQPQHGRLPAALHAGWPGVRLPGQTGLVNAPPPPPSAATSETRPRRRVVMPSSLFSQDFFSSHHCLSLTNL